jgi:hypothetical protein
MIPSAETIGDFDNRKYVVCRAMLQEPALSLYYKYARKQAAAGRMDPGDEQVPNTPNAYGDLFMDGLLNDLVPLVQHATGRMVFPTYSYLRVYKTGDVLARHTDRDACEISVTLCLGYDASGPWPIWIEGPQGVASVELEPGDSLVYCGIECPHWRDAFEGQHQAQVFLHYVDRTGPHATRRFDKRLSLTTPTVLR